MIYAADLHLHSPYARAVSPRITFENMAQWAKVKGIDLLASADFTHPAWFAQTRRTLRECGDGLLEHGGVRFVLGTEVNCSAKQGGRLRRVHMLLFAPNLDAAARINAAIAPRGALDADGRPTLRMTPRDLLSEALAVDDRAIVMPAHAWTPHFGVFGAKSGFDSLSECFGDLTPQVPAVETGLSSDPSMNWRLPELDNLSVVSFSDAHSLSKMARELTLFDGELSYDGLRDALRSQSVHCTIEFFPEEGKYHNSGHRNCGVNLTPAEAVETGGICPRCGRRMTPGVMQRVEELAAMSGGRPAPALTRGDDGLTRGSNGRPPFRSLVGLQQIIAEAVGRGVNAKSVQTQYERLVNELGSELHILTAAATADIMLAAGQPSGAAIAQGVDRVRKGDIRIVPGYDGVFGKVSVWDAGERGGDSKGSAGAGTGMRPML